MNSVFDLIGFVARNTVAVAPWFLLSVTLGVLVRSLKLADALGSALARRPMPAIAAAVAIGAFSPFCSCTVVPVVAGLLVAGVPLAPVMAFWVSSPTMDPEIFTFTVAMLGWPLAVSRLIATLALSAGAGIGIHLLTRAGKLRNPLQRTVVDSCETDCEQTTPDPAPTGGTAVLVRPTTVVQRLIKLDFGKLSREIGRESWLLGRWLLAAFALESVILTTVPQETIASQLGSGNAWSIPLAAIIGVPLYVSNLTALPIISGLLDQGMSNGAAMAFLLSGPVTTVPAMVAVRPLVRRNVFWYYIAVALIGSILLGAAIEVALP